MTESPDKLAMVRAEVRRLLEESRAFGQLPPEERKKIASDLVRVSSYLADPGWLDADTPARAKALAESQAVEEIKERLAQAPGQVGQDFRAGAVREWVEAFERMVQAVDFPDFVSGLIQGVFRAVVDASIEQMQAYGELLSAVTKSVEQFANDNIAEPAARDFIANRYPSLVVIDTSGEKAKLKEHPDAEGLDELTRHFGLSSVDLDDEAAELALVNAAKLEMARSRQQMLATMVLLGINRIVITNGRINAKVVFDMRASDQASRRAKASLHDEVKSKSSAAAAAATWSPWGAGAAGASTSRSHQTTVTSSVEDQSESKAEVKAQLSGDVRLSFKSETFPLERMADMGAMGAINQKAAPNAPADTKTTSGTPKKPAPVQKNA